MKFKLPQQLEKFDFYIEKLRSKEAIVELNEMRKPRTIQANKYLHVLITLFAIETGYNLDEMKTTLKRECNFMRYEKNGNIFLKKSSGLDTKELADWITWIRNYAAMKEFYLPSSEDYYRNFSEIEKEIHQEKLYL